MEYEDKDLLKDLELGLDGTCLPIEIDNRSDSTNAENCPKEKEEKIIEDFEGLGGNEIPAFSIMENLTVRDGIGLYLGNAVLVS